MGHSASQPAAAAEAPAELGAVPTPAPPPAHGGHYQLPAAAVERVRNELRPPPLLRLRPEVLRRVIEFAPELIPLSEVSRAFHLATTDDRLWREAHDEMPWERCGAPPHGFHCEGRLLKWVNVAHGTKPRWCVVDGAQLMYYNSAEEAVGDAPPRKVLQLPPEQLTVDEEQLQLRVGGLVRSSSPGGGGGGGGWGGVATLYLTAASADDLLRWRWFLGAAGDGAYRLPDRPEYLPSDLQCCCWKQQTMQRFRGAFEASARAQRRREEERRVLEEHRRRRRRRLEELKQRRAAVDRERTAAVSAARATVKRAEKRVSRIVAALWLVVAVSLLRTRPCWALVWAPGSVVGAVQYWVLDCSSESRGLFLGLLCGGASCVRWLAHALSLVALVAGFLAAGDKLARAALRDLPTVDRYIEDVKHASLTEVARLQAAYKPRIEAIEEEIRAVKEQLPPEPRRGGGGLPCVIS